MREYHGTLREAPLAVEPGYPSDQSDCYTFTAVPGKVLASVREELRHAGWSADVSASDVTEFVRLRGGVLRKAFFATHVGKYWRSSQVIGEAGIDEEDVTCAVWIPHEETWLENKIKQLTKSFSSSPPPTYFLALPYANDVQVSFRPEPRQRRTIVVVECSNISVNPAEVVLKTLVVGGKSPSEPLPLTLHLGPREKTSLVFNFASRWSLVLPWSYEYSFDVERQYGGGSGSGVGYNEQNASRERGGPSP